MIAYSIPVPDSVVVAHIVSKSSKCEIVRLDRGDAESGDLIRLHCGRLTKSLGFAPKGLSVDEISSCDVVIVLNAVHFPSLINVRNCEGSPKIVNVGRQWSSTLERVYSINRKSLEYISYERIKNEPACYNVSVTFDLTSNKNNTSYDSKAAKYCIENQMSGAGF